MAGIDDPAFYGDRWAGVYDEHFAGLDSAPAVEFFAGLVGDGPALELAIGTGRIALPLAARGITVECVDAPTITGEGVYGDLPVTSAREQLITANAAYSGGRLRRSSGVSAAALRRRADPTWGVLLDDPEAFAAPPGPRRPAPEATP